MKRYLWPACISVLILLGSCSKFSLPFFGNKDTEYPRAFYVQKQSTLVDEPKEISISGDLPEVVGLIQTAMDTLFQANSYTLRIESGGGGYTGPRPIMRVITEQIQADSLEGFEKYFNKGEYILDQPNIFVRADDPSYTIETIIKMDGNDFLTTFQASASIDWNIYRVDPETQDTVIVSEEKEKMYGVGEYRFQEEKSYVNRRGQEDTFKVWREVPIEDQPTTKRYLEQKLRQKIIELAAFRNLRAAQRPAR